MVRTLSVARSVASMSDSGSNPPEPLFNSSQSLSNALESISLQTYKPAQPPSLATRVYSGPSILVRHRPRTTVRKRCARNESVGDHPAFPIRLSRRRTGRRLLDDERVSVWPRGPATARTRATPRTTVRPPRWSRFGRRRRRTLTQVPIPLRRAPVGTRLRLETRAYSVRGDTFGADSYAFPSARYSSATGSLLVVSTAWRVGSDRITVHHRPLGSSHGLIACSQRRIRRATVAPRSASLVRCRHRARRPAVRTNAGRRYRGARGAFAPGRSVPGAASRSRDPRESITTARVAGGRGPESLEGEQLGNGQPVIARTACNSAPSRPILIVISSSWGSSVRSRSPAATRRHGLDALRMPHAGLSAHL